MAIPQINAEQVELMEKLASGLSAFCQAIPDAKLDSVVGYEDGMRVSLDNGQLLILGLVKEVTDDPVVKEKLVNMYAMTSRLYRVFEITETGKAMFSGPERRIQ